MKDLIWIIVVLLIIGWVLGFAVFPVGNLIHILLVIAIIVIVYKLITGRRL
ncbi:lmo0937 family membrane protein [Aquimarina sp. M1]